MAFKMALNSEMTIWGYKKSDYINMFSLSKQCLQKNILDCVSGYSTFNSEMLANGSNVVSIHPLYDLSADSLAMHPLMKNKINTKMLKDYRKGQLRGRYQAATLPFLKFKDYEFEIALAIDCYSDNVTRHTEVLKVASYLELARVAKEVRFRIITGQSTIPSFFKTLENILQEECKKLVINSVSNSLHDCKISA